MFLILFQSLLNIVIQVKRYLAFRLLNLKPNKASHELLTSRDFKVSGVFLKELIEQCLACRYVLDVIYEKTMNNEVLARTLHKDSLLTVDRLVSVVTHPSGYLGMPSSCSLFCAVDCFT